MGRPKLDSDPRKRRRIVDKPAPCAPSPGTSSDELSTGSDPKQSVYAQPETFNHLLAALGSGTQSLAAAYRRQIKQNSTIDSEEPEGEGSESSDASSVVDSGRGSSGDSSGSQSEENDFREDKIADIAGQREDTEVEYGVQDFDTDLEKEIDNTGNTTASQSESKSSFHAHLEHTLTKEEVDELLKRACKYKWERPAFGSSSSKWKGTGECFLKEAGTDVCNELKLKLYKHWLDFYKKSGGSDFQSSRQSHFFSICNSYRDIQYCSKKPFYLKGIDEDTSIMDAYIMHMLNHIFRTRNIVLKNDTKLAKNPDCMEAEILHGGGFLDRGFTRPKVLLLLPFRSIAQRTVKRLIQLTPPSHKVNVEHLDRFYREFGIEDDKEEEDMGGNLDDNLKHRKSNKPADFELLFEGNTSEEFAIGIKFTRGSIKLYSDFYYSDIIVASPVQLVQAIGKAEAEKDKDVDYLSSIEILIIDHADILAMQNWSHLNSILEHLNKIPTDQHGTDIMRVRPWYLDGQACFYRQTILLGSFINPDMNALFNHHCANYEGKVKYACDYRGNLPKVLLPVRQVFERFQAPSIADADDARFDYFVKKVYPKIRDSIQGGIMLFISSYFDFVRIRNFLKFQSASFCLLGEYTKQADVSRARVWFFQGKRKFMLYTERAHFYHRYKIRGIQNLIIYSLPERKEFYPEVVNMLDGAKNMSCTVLFSRFDNLQLERIVGSTASKKMISSDKDIFVFC